MYGRLYVFLIPAMVWATDASGGQLHFQWLDFQDGSSAAGACVSPDGSTLVVNRIYWVNNAAHFEATIWRGFGDTTGLGHYDTAQHSMGIATSHDGTVVVGVDESVSNTWRTAFRWENGEHTSLGDLPGGSLHSAANDVSWDGTIVVGSGRTDQGTEAFRWAHGEMVALQDLPGGPLNTNAWGISGDGRVIVGDGVSQAGQEAVRWIDGIPEALGDLPGGPYSASAHAASQDGSVIVGFSWSEQGHEAFRWQNGVMLGLGVLGGSSYAEDVSADGQSVVGYTSSGAFLWTEAEGMRSIESILAEHEIGLDNYVLMHASSISADGSRIAGWALRGGSEYRSWVLTIPEPASGIAVFAIFLIPIARNRPVAELPVALHGSSQTKVAS